MKAIISGSGIGGLSAAHGLLSKGYEVEVWERRSSPNPLGAGLIVQPNARWALRELGLDEAIEEVGSPVRIGRMMNFKGRVVSEMDLSFGGRRPLALGIHRATLFRILSERLPAGTIRFDLEVERAVPEGFLTVGASRVETDADVWVAADGIHSKVAQQLGCPPIRYAGYTCWRGVANVSPAEVGAEDGVLTEITGPGARFGVVPIDGGRTYWFATDNRPQNEPFSPEQAQEDLLAVFKGFPRSAQELIRATPTQEVLRHDIIDRPPRTSWGQGNVTLLGDAAHPMTPNLGQGAGQAIVDAAALTRHLDGAAKGDIEAALRAYEAERIPKTKLLVEASFNFGRLGQLESGLLRWLRDLVLKSTPAAVTEKQVTKLTG